MIRSRRAHGFTLIEVLVALVIVAFGMGALMATLTSAATSVDHLREKSFAEWVALNRISEVRLGKAAPTSGKTSGDSEFAGQRWRWTQNITPTGLANMIRIDVSVARAGAKADDATAEIAVATGFTSSPGTITPNLGLLPDWSLETAGRTPPAGGPGTPNNPATPGATPSPTPPPPATDPRARQ